jgi:hypothetical protein
MAAEDSHLVLHLCEPDFQRVLGILKCLGVINDLGLRSGTSHFVSDGDFQKRLTITQGLCLFWDLMPHSRRQAQPAMKVSSCTMGPAPILQPACHIPVGRAAQSTGLLRRNGGMP